MYPREFPVQIDGQTEMESFADSASEFSSTESLQRHRTADNLRYPWGGGDSLQKRNSQLFSWDDDFWKQPSRKGPQSLASSASTFEEVESLCLSKSSSDSMGASHRQWDRSNGGSGYAGGSSRRFISRQSSTTSTSTSRSSGLVGDGAGGDQPSEYNLASRPSITDTLLESMELLGSHGNLDLADKLYLEKIFQRVIDWNNGMPIAGSNSTSAMDRHFFGTPQQQQQQQQQRSVRNQDSQPDQNQQVPHSILKDKLEKLKQGEQQSPRRHLHSQSGASPQAPNPEKKRRRDLIIPDEEEVPSTSYKYHRSSDVSDRRGGSTRGSSAYPKHSSASSKELSSDSFSRNSYMSSMSSFSMDNPSLRSSPQGSTAPAAPPLLSHPSIATYLPSHSLKQCGSFDSTASPPDPYMFTQPYTTSHAERVLMGLGFGASEGFLPERFLRDWYTKISRAQVESQMAHMTDIKEKESFEIPSSNSYNALSRQAMMTSAEYNQRQQAPLRRESSVHQSQASLDESVSYLPPGGQDSKNQRLKEYIAAYSNNIPAPDESRDMKVKQFANSRQKSLPLYLETLNEEDEGRSRMSGVDPFDKEARLQMFISDAMSNSGKSSNSENSHISSNQSESDSMSSCSERRGHSSRRQHHLIQQRQAYQKHIAEQLEKEERIRRLSEGEGNKEVTDSKKDKNVKTKVQKSPNKQISLNTETKSNAKTSPSRRKAKTEENAKQKTPSRHPAVEVNDYERSNSPQNREVLSTPKKKQLSHVEQNKENRDQTNVDERKEKHQRVQQVMHSKDSLEVADIMQNQTTKSRHSAMKTQQQEESGSSQHVEPAMISIVLEDVDQDSGGRGTDLLSVPQNHLNLPLSRCSSISLSPIPQSPVTVIEVGLDNQQDSLDTEGTASSKDTDEENNTQNTSSVSSTEGGKRRKRSRSRGALLDKPPKPHEIQRRRSSGRASPLPSQLGAGQAAMDGGENYSAKRRLSLEVPLIPEIRHLLERQRALQNIQDKDGNADEPKKSTNSGRRASFSEEDPVIIDDALKERCRSPRLGRRSVSPNDGKKRRHKHRRSQDSNEDKNDEVLNITEKQNQSQEETMVPTDETHHSRKRLHSPTPLKSCLHKEPHYEDVNQGIKDELPTFADQISNLSYDRVTPDQQCQIRVPRSNESSPGSNKSAFRYTGKGAKGCSPTSYLSETDVDEFPSSVKMGLKPRPISSIAKNLQTENLDIEGTPQKKVPSLESNDIPSPTLKFSDHRPIFCQTGQQLSHSGKVYTISRAVQVTDATFPYKMVNSNVPPRRSNSPEYFYACDRGAQCNLTPPDLVQGINCFTKFTQTGVPAFEMSSQTSESYCLSISQRNSGTGSNSHSKGINTIVCLIGAEHNSDNRASPNSPRSDNAVSRSDLNLTDFDIVDETLQMIEAELNHIKAKEQVNTINSNFHGAASSTPVDDELLLLNFQRSERSRSVPQNKFTEQRLARESWQSRSLTVDERLPIRFAPSTWQAATALPSKFDQENQDVDDNVSDFVRKSDTTGSLVEKLKYNNFSSYVDRPLSKLCTFRSDTSGYQEEDNEESDDRQSKSSFGFGFSSKRSKLMGRHFKSQDSTNSLSYIPPQALNSQKFLESEIDSIIPDLDTQRGQQTELNVFPTENQPLIELHSVPEASQNGEHNDQNSTDYPTVESKDIMVKMFELQQGLATYLQPCQGMYDHYLSKPMSDISLINSPVESNISSRPLEDELDSSQNEETSFVFPNANNRSEPRRISSPVIGAPSADRGHSKLSRLKYQKNSHENSCSSLDIEVDFMNAGQPLGVNHNSRPNMQGSCNGNIQPNTLQNNGIPLLLPVPAPRRNLPDISTSNVAVMHTDTLNSSEETKPDLLTQSDSSKKNNVRPNDSHKDANDVDAGSCQNAKHTEDSKSEVSVAKPSCEENFSLVTETINSKSPLSLSQFMSAKSIASNSSTPEIVISPLKAFQMDFLQVPGSPQDILTKARYPSSSSSPASSTPSSRLASPRSPTTETTGSSDVESYLNSGSESGYQANRYNASEVPPVNEPASANQKEKLSIKIPEIIETRKGSMTDSDIPLSSVESVTEFSHISSIEQSMDEFSDASMYPMLSAGSVMDEDDYGDAPFDVDFDIDDNSHLDDIEIGKFDATGMHPPVFDPDILKLKHKILAGQRSQSQGSRPPTRSGRESIEAASVKSLVGSDGVKDVDDMDVLWEESRSRRMSSESSYSDPVIDITDSLSQDSLSSATSKDCGVSMNKMNYLRPSNRADDLLQVSDYGGMSPSPPVMKRRSSNEYGSSPVHTKRMTGNEETSGIPHLSVNRAQELPPEPIKCKSDSDDDEQDPLAEEKMREKLKQRRGSRRGSKDNWDVVQSVLLWQSKENPDNACLVEEIAEDLRQTLDKDAPETSLDTQTILDDLPEQANDSSGDECDKEISRITLHRPIVRRLVKMSSDPVDKEMYCRSVQMQQMKEKTAQLEQDCPIQEESVDTEHENGMRHTRDVTGMSQTTEKSLIKNAETSDMLEIFQNADLSTLKDISNYEPLCSMSEDQDKRERDDVDSSKESDSEADNFGGVLYDTSDIVRVLDIEFTDDNVERPVFREGRENSEDQLSTGLMEELEMIALFKQIDDFDKISSSLHDEDTDTSPRRCPLSQITEEETQSEDNLSQGGRQHVWQVRNRFIVAQDTQDTTLEGNVTHLSVSSRSSEISGAEYGIDVGSKSLSDESPLQRQNAEFTTQISTENDPSECDDVFSDSVSPKNVESLEAEQNVSNSVFSKLDPETSNVDMKVRAVSPRSAVFRFAQALMIGNSSDSESVDTTCSSPGPSPTGMPDLDTDSVFENQSPVFEKDADKTDARVNISASPALETHRIEKTIDAMGNRTTKSSISRTVRITHFDTASPTTNGPTKRFDEEIRHVSTAAITIGDYRKKKPVLLSITQSPQAKRETISEDISTKLTTSRRNTIIKALKAKLSTEASLSMDHSNIISKESESVSTPEETALSVKEDCNTVKQPDTKAAKLSQWESQEEQKDKVRSMFLLGNTQDDFKKENKGCIKEDSITAKQTDSVASKQTDSEAEKLSQWESQEEQKDKVRSMLLIGNTQGDFKKENKGSMKGDGSTAKQTDSKEEKQTDSKAAKQTDSKAAKLSQWESQEELKDKVRSMLLIGNTQGDFKKENKGVIKEDGNTAKQTDSNTAKQTDSKAAKQTDSKAAKLSQWESQEELKDKVRSMFLLGNTQGDFKKENKGVIKEDGNTAKQTDSNTPKQTDSNTAKQTDSNTAKQTDSKAAKQTDSKAAKLSQWESQEELKDKVRSMFLLGNTQDDFKRENKGSIKDEKACDAHVASDRKIAEITTPQDPTINQDVNNKGAQDSFPKAHKAFKSVSSGSDCTQPRSSDDGEPIEDVRARVKAMLLINHKHSTGSSDSNKEHVKTVQTSQSSSNTNKALSSVPRRVKVTTMFSQNSEDSPSFISSAMSESSDNESSPRGNSSMYNIRTQFYEKDVPKKAMTSALKEKPRQRLLRSRGSLLKLHQQANVFSPNSSDTESELTSALSNQGDYDIRERDLALGRLSNDNNDEDDPSLNKTLVADASLPTKTQGNGNISSCAEKVEEDSGICEKVPDSHSHVPASVESPHSATGISDSKHQEKAFELLAPKVLIQQPSEDNGNYHDPFRKFSLPVISQSHTLSALSDNNDNHLHSEKLLSPSSDPGDVRWRSAKSPRHGSSSLYGRRSRSQFLSPNSALNQRRPQDYYVPPQSKSSTGVHDSTHPELSYLDIIPKLSQQQESRASSPPDKRHEIEFVISRPRQTSDQTNISGDASSSTALNALTDTSKKITPVKPRRENLGLRGRIGSPTYNLRRAPQFMNTETDASLSIAVSDSLTVDIPSEHTEEDHSTNTSLTGHEVSSKSEGSTQLIVLEHEEGKSESSSTCKKSLSVTSRDSGFDSQGSPIDVAHKLADWKSTPFSVVSEESTTSVELGNEGNSYV